MQMFGSWMVISSCSEGKREGLPPEFIEAHRDAAIRIPMSENTRTRSFNLSNSANIILFEALRQLGFPDLK